MERQLSITPEDHANPFEPPTSHLSCFSIIKMILVGLVLFIPRLVLTALIVFFMYFTALGTCACCCEGELLSEEEGSYEKYPKSRTCFRFIMRIYTRLLLFVWGYYWISVDTHEDAVFTPEGQPEPAIVVSNHTSFVDPIVIFTKCGTITAVGKEEAATAPIVGRIATALQVLSVSRTNPNSRRNVANEIVRRARWNVDQPKAEVEEHGDWAKLMIFAEGTCCNGKALASFKCGPFMSMTPVRAFATTFPSCWADVSWVGNRSFVGVFMMMMCQVYNRCNILELGDIAPPAEALAEYEEMKREPSGNSSSGMGSPHSSNGSISDKQSPSSVFAEHVRQKFAKAMCIPMTEHSYDDVRLDYAFNALFGDAAGSLTGELQLKHSGLKYNKAKEILKEFASFDGNKDGQISKTDFQKFLKIEDTEITDRIFEEWDKDGNGTISFKEFLRNVEVMKLQVLRSRAAVAISNGTESEEMVREKTNVEIVDGFEALFASFDAQGDSDGFLSRDEFQQGMLSVVPGIAPQSLDRLFDEIDKSKDGLLSVEEFTGYCTAHPQLMTWIVDSIAKHDLYQ